MARVPTVDHGRRRLFRAAAVGILLAVSLLRQNCGAEMDLFDGFGIFNVPDPLPAAAAGWFRLFESDPLSALILFGLVDLANYALVGLLFLALYVALRPEYHAAALVATASAMIGIGVYFASNQAFAMHGISARYAATTGAAERAALLSAGEALLATYNPGAIYHGTGIYLSRMLVLLGGLLFALLMLRSPLFGRGTGWLGIVANGAALLYFPAQALAPPLIVIPIPVSAPFRLLWYIMIARRLFQLSRGGAGESADHRVRLQEP